MGTKSNKPLITVHYIDSEGVISQDRVHTSRQAAAIIRHILDAMEDIEPGDMFLVTGAEPLSEEIGITRAVSPDQARAKAKAKRDLRLVSSRD